MGKGKVSVGVGLSPLVESINDTTIGTPVSLKLISGLDYTGIIWRNIEVICDDVPTLENNTVIFEKEGFYVPVILDYPQHESYGIKVRKED